MNKLSFLPLCFFTGLACLAGPGARADIMSEFPSLKKYIHAEPETHIRFGVGISPVGIMENKAMVSFNLFQVHWINGDFDIEAFSGSFGTTISGDPLSKLQSFTFRTIPKYRFSESISVGPLVGYEFVSYPDVIARIYKKNAFAPEEPFSSSGLIYGAAVSQTFNLSEKYTLKINEIFYQQTYDTKGTFNDWKYFYKNDLLNSSQDPIAPGPVVVLELSLLF